MRSLSTCCLIGALLFALGATRANSSEDEYKVIVDPDNPIKALDRAFLRDVFLKKTTRWPHGETVHPIDLAQGFPARDRFSKEVLNRLPMQVRRYWAQRIFSGIDIPPPEAESADAAIAYVVTHAGGIAYIPASVDPGAAKVITIE